ncbi:complex I subunit 4 family protein [Amycolatopsis sp. H20-H5]|uniref:complex I subunit 4 family protein n=1 Tax=Amycolatopsis sp. H20-H5 TaxID=3046309 RepID=UPI002DB74054|nr:NADH-quinone oxidoreductase subunit M [Amycolatopsis sp. H20-H5]MEC3974412.1 NADH-quinone oxidoreductase subunit M [Amycolatopsis sp. H20-H5]
MLSLIVFLPLLAALGLYLVPRRAERFVRVAGIAVTGVVLLLVVVLWLGYRTPPAGHFAFEERLRWIPSLGAGYHLGVDGLSLPLVAMSALLFFVCAIYSWREKRRIREYTALFLLLEAVSIGVFLALDLVLFFVFWDLSIVGMYFVIALWGHGDRRRSALKFFLYTFLGSLALLLGIIGLYVFASPATFDMVELTLQTPLATAGAAAPLVMLGLVIGFGVKTPVVPVHTWLPPAHTDAPATGSAILAGVLLKMGTYGFLRVAMPMLPDTWRDWSWALIALGVVSVLWGALVALAQRDFKRMIAYTSVNHMGYILLAIGAAGLVADSPQQARELAITGAVVQMVSHGLITGALFLLAGVLHDRGGTYDLEAWGGLANPAPVFAGATAIAAFASLGLPGLSGFIAEFHIFLGSMRPAPIPTALAFLGILLTAALFLIAVQKLLLGPVRGRSEGVRDLRSHEAIAVLPLLALSGVIGIFPRFLLDIVEPASRAVTELVAR